MPLILPKTLPAHDILRNEGLTIESTCPDNTSHVRILFLNLMPEKQDAELDFLRAIYDSEVWVEVLPIKMSNLRYKTTPQAYMDAHYEDIALVMARGEQYEGLVINGAPFQDYKFEEIIYWQQLQVFFRWSDTHVGHSLYICWGALARTFHDWGIRFERHPVQWSGIYPFDIITKGSGLVDDSLDKVLSPVSRPVRMPSRLIYAIEGLEVILDNDEVGPSLYMTSDGRHVFSLNHPEYGPQRLDFEYHRDLSRGKSPMRPINYYANETSEDDVRFTWLETRRNLFGGWLKKVTADYKTNLYNHNKSLQRWNRH